MRSFMQVFIVAIVCFALGLVTTRYFQTSMSQDMKSSVAAELKSLKSEIKKVRMSASGRSIRAMGEMPKALKDAKVFEDRSNVPKEKEVVQRGPHGQELLTALQEGGFTLFFRHTARDKIKKDSLLAFDMLTLTKSGLQHPTFTKALCLNNHGRAEAWLIGKAFKNLNIPVGKVMSSPVCRARELAENAFGRVDQLTPALAYRRMFESSAEADAALSNLRTLLEEPPAPGTNNILTSHSNVLKHFPDLKLALNQADAAVFRRSPEGKLIYASRIAIADWVKWMDHVDPASSWKPGKNRVAGH